MVFRKKNILLKRKQYFSKTIKNAKFKQKAKKMVEQHRKQTLLEKTYDEHENNSGTIEADVLQFAEGIDHKNFEENAFERLMQAFHNKDVTVPCIENAPIRNHDCYNVEEKSVTKMSSTCLKDIANNEVTPAHDTFSVHFNYDLPLECVDKLWSEIGKTTQSNLCWPYLNNIKLDTPVYDKAASKDNLAAIRSKVEKLQPDSLLTLGLKNVLLQNVANKMTPLQLEALNILNEYVDFYYPHRTQNYVEQLRTVYTLHILNHMLKTRSCILKHNLKLSMSTANSATIADGFQDQGLARPKVLIILPFRKYAYQIVECIAQLIFGKSCEHCKQDGRIINYSRFYEEFTGDTLHFAKSKPKPEDYIETFKGNIDDNFKIGISLTKKNIKLYTDFNASDLIIASPLGLRIGITSDNGEAANYDFLNSIEILVMDHVELFLAQNWENLLFILEHLHLQPQSLQNVNLQRVRPWSLNGLCRYYRQSVIIASHELPEMRALFHNKCFNYCGRAHVTCPVTQGDITNVYMNIPQIFHCIDIPKLDSLYDLRFEYFIREILPQYKKSSFAHCMIYVPSYFDFVRLRNFLKQETISFAQICEYTKKAKVARARDMFFHSGVQFLLYSERYHFFQRTRIKGIRHLIMYQPPSWPQFYSEMVNMMNESNQNSADGLSDSTSIIVLYTKYDLIQLNAVLGSESTAKLADSNKIIHSFSIN